MISVADLDFIRQLVRRNSAITLDESKAYLIENRLTSLASKEGFDSIQGLVTRLRSEPDHQLIRKVVEAMTTNETLFFRDFHPFEALRRTVVPELMEKRASERRIRIWSAACSSGQEPYSIAMTLLECPELASWDVRIIATDLSTEVLARAAQGRYSQLEVNRGVPAQMLLRYFTRSGLEWHVKDDVRRMIEFKEANLIEAWPAMPKLDVVFIRNVMIYFEVDVKKQILNRMRGVLAPHAYMFLGSAETTIGLDDGFERSDLERCGAYRVRADKGSALSSSTTSSVISHTVKGPHLTAGNPNPPSSLSVERPFVEFQRNRSAMSKSGY